MEKKEMTLREAVQMLADKGITIKWADGNDLEDFISYYDQHYAPLLPRLAEKNRGKTGAIRFLASDIMAIFSA